MRPASSSAAPSSPARLHRDQALFFDNLLAAGVDHPDPYISNMATELKRSVRRNTAPDNGWDFAMIGRLENRAAVSFLRKESTRPLVALEVWAVIIEHLSMNDSVIPLTRAELAREVGCTASHISEVMTELETLGAVTRERHACPGVRGPGVVRYSVNPWFATRLSNGDRVAAQSKVPRPKRPKLRAIKGGLSSPSERRSRAPLLPMPVL